MKRQDNLLEGEMWQKSRRPLKIIIKTDACWLEAEDLQFSSINSNFLRILYIDVWLPGQQV